MRDAGGVAFSRHSLAQICGHFCGLLVCLTNMEHINPTVGINFYKQKNQAGHSVLQVFLVQIAIASTNARLH